MASPMERSPSPFRIVVTVRVDFVAPEEGIAHSNRGSAVTQVSASFCKTPCTMQSECCSNCSKEIGINKLPCSWLFSISSYFSAKPASLDAHPIPKKAENRKTSRVQIKHFTFFMMISLFSIFFNNMISAMPSNR